MVDIGVVVGVFVDTEAEAEGKESLFACGEGVQRFFITTDSFSSLELSFSENKVRALTSASGPFIVLLFWASVDCRINSTH